MSVPRIYERIFMALRSATSQSTIKRAIFNRAIDIGLKVVESISDENGFVDVYPHMDITCNTVLDTGKNIASSKLEQAFSTSSYVDLAIAIGDNHKFIGALIVPNFEEFITLLDQKRDHL